MKAPKFKWTPGIERAWCRNWELICNAINKKVSPLSKPVKIPGWRKKKGSK